MSDDAAALTRIASIFEAGSDPYRAAPPELPNLQIAAMRSRYAQLRARIRLLERRAADLSAPPREPADFVPLLFSHETYKSYPEAFLSRENWAGLTRWLQTLSAQPISGADLTGITDVDDWMLRLRAVGHYVFSSSGTSGKCSFVSQTAADLQRVVDATLAMTCAGHASIRERRGRWPVFSLGPPTGAHRNVETSALAAARLGREVHFMFEERAAAADTLRMARMRRALASGEASPAQIAEFERSAAERQARVARRLETFIDELVAHRHEPVLVMGGWVMHWHLSQHGRARGHGGALLHPESVMTAGGGLKGTSAPPDYRERILEAYGLAQDRCLVAYGMSEMIGTNPWSSAGGGYALCPWIVPLVLDKAGERLLAGPGSRGLAEGRFAFFDLLAEGYWGGIITGDKVTIDFGPHGDPDGYRTPLVRNVARYADLEEGEDKLSCAGTMEAYVRGMIAPEL